MRYYGSAVLESEESADLPIRFGKSYAPRGAVTLARDTLVSSAATGLTETAWGPLATAADSGSWAFLTRREAERLSGLREGRSFGAFADEWPAEALGGPEEFLGLLFRRGLVTLDGATAADPAMFEDSPNIHNEGRLIELLLSEKCNLGCLYCLAGARPGQPHMSRETAFLAVDAAYAVDDERGLTFEYSGGEAFLRWELMQELTAYIRAHPERRGRPVNICVQTNGTLFTPERIEWLRANHVTVGLSLDGDPESHNVSRPQVNGGESFSRVMRGVDMLQRAGVPFGALVVLNRANAGDPRKLLDFLTQNGIGSVKVNPIAFLGDARQKWDAMGMEQAEIVAWFKEFLALLVRRDADLIESNAIDMTRHLVSKRRASRCLRGHCGAGEGFVAVGADGSLYPCGRATQSPGLKLGNIRDARRIDDPGRENPHVVAIRERRPQDYDDCRVCPYRAFCQAGCPAQSYERYGTVRHKTPECAFFKSMYPHLMGWLAHEAAAMSHMNRRFFAPSGTPLALTSRALLPELQHHAA
ncbi:radical SAM protein [Neomegalonema sp.]|uniref:radical SAM/SPASM domain-containing protein n=1 Tax=Neomegalonema sp. TaxID=2039713 RepID=UPI002639303F|nr:radical SAM protein [Neomegalonema sp.]MDD2867455.1 radical SAM protein [Neomegalonema sp.]